MGEECPRIGERSAGSRLAAGARRSKQGTRCRHSGQGGDAEARLNCVIGAVKDFISYYNNDTQAKEFCESLDRDLRETCLQTGEDYYETFNL